MADVKAKVKTPKKKASKREKKDWIAAYILIAPVTLGHNWFAGVLYLAVYPECLVQF